MTGVGRCTDDRGSAWLRGGARVLALASSLLAPLLIVDTSAAAVTAPSTSYYETSASAKSLSLQGEATGRAGTQGIVILDFGRPASDGTHDGTFSFARTVLSFGAISSGVESFIMGYYNTAPAHTTLDVAVGTNDSCGLYQRCGPIVCGCPDEPTNYITWGHELAATVQQLAAWSARVASSNGFTDTVRVVAADDAEPAFDPGFNNTEYVMRGYAEATHGSAPPMVDFGSADPGIWSNDQLLQVANGFAPNVAMPQIYTPGQIGEWAALVAYDKARYGGTFNIYGVMTLPTGGAPAQNAVARMLGALAPITGQNTMTWWSAITR